MTAIAAPSTRKGTGVALAVDVTVIIHEYNSYSLKRLAQNSCAAQHLHMLTKIVVVALFLLAGLGDADADKWRTYPVGKLAKVDLPAEAEVEQRILGGDFGGIPGSGPAVTTKIADTMFQAMAWHKRIINPRAMAALEIVELQLLYQCDGLELVEVNLSPWIGFSMLCKKTHREFPIRFVCLASTFGALSIYIEKPDKHFAPKILDSLRLSKEAAK